MGRPVTTAPQSLYQDSDNFSTTPFLAKTRKYSSAILVGFDGFLVAEFEYVSEHSGGDG
jgi:hypothetical protein